DTRTEAAFVDSFQEAFNASDAVLAELKDLLRWGRVQVFSLSGSELHAMVNTDGTALCAVFRFFVTGSGPARRFPALPPKGFSDGDNQICAGFGNTGALGRVDGTV